MLILTCVVGVLLSLLVYFYSPPRIAIHFNYQGFPNGWMNKNNNLILWIMLYLLITGLYLSINYFLKGTSTRLMKYSGKEISLNPEEKEEKVWLISNHIFKLGATCNLFFIVLQLTIFRVNIHKEPRLNIATVNVIIGLFLFYITIWIVQLYKKIKRLQKGKLSNYSG